MGRVKEFGMEEQERQLANEETALSFELDGLLTSNKAYRTTLAQSVVQDVSEGNLDATQVFIYAKKAEDFFKDVVNNVKPFVAAKQIQKGGITLYESTIIEKKDPDKYDFSVCSDSTYNEMIVEMEQLKAKIKERETFLKALTEPVSTLDGEIINPPIKTFGSQNVAVSFR